MLPLEQHFQDFLRERTYVDNVTERTLMWYQTAFKSYLRSRSDGGGSDAGALITKRDLQQFVIHLRERGVKPVSCSCYLRAMNSFCRWLHQQALTPQEVRLPLQRLEKRLLRTFDDAALKKLIGYKPRIFQQWRIHTLACTILDTGCRMHEVLLAPTTAFDFDSLLLTVQGKGRKERRVPLSFELRKLLFRWQQRKEKAHVASTLMFPARNGGTWHYRNARRAYYGLLERLGLARTGFHHLRHTMATSYLRAGGDVVRLSMIIGHTEVSTTMKYSHLLTEDLQAPHQRLSILNRIR